MYLQTGSESKKGAEFRALAKKVLLQGLKPLFAG
jgi:hypothetical protein